MIKNRNTYIGVVGAVVFALVSLFAGAASADPPERSCGTSFFSAEKDDPCEIREQAVDELVAALESYGADQGTYVVAGGGSRGNGQGWAFYQGGVYAKSTANVLMEMHHLTASPIHDELWTSQTSIAGDVLVYTCKDRVGVFTREGTGAPEAEDLDWWNTNGCTRYPIDHLNAQYFAVSVPVLASEEQRRDAVNGLVTALESSGSDEGSYVVAGGGSRGHGQGWAFYQGGVYAESTVNVLIQGGHMPSVPQRDELWTSHSSIAGDMLVYVCNDRVAVFTREGNGQPSAEDRDWWDANGCSRYPIDRLGVTYFALSKPL